MSDYYEEFWGAEGCAEASWEQVWQGLDQARDGIDGLHGQVEVMRGGVYAQRALKAACRAILSGSAKLKDEARSLHRFVAAGDLDAALWESRMRAVGAAAGVDTAEVERALDGARRGA